VWSAAMNTLAWKAYLGDVYGTDVVPAYAAPTRAHDLSGLAPAYIHVGARDRFLQEALDYASRLMNAGVPVELHVLPNAPHAFDIVAPCAPVSKAALALSEAALGRALTRARPARS